MPSKNGKNGRRLEELRTEAWRRAERETEGWSLWIPLTRLRELCGARSVRDRLLGVAILQDQIGDEQVRGYLTVLARLLGDPICRAQSVRLIAEFLAEDPDAVWKLVSSHGASEDEAVRLAVASLLEKLLEHDFDRYFRRLKRRVKDGAELLLDTLASCWCDLNKARRRQVHELLEAHGRSALHYAG